MEPHQKPVGSPEGSERDLRRQRDRVEDARRSPEERFGRAIKLSASAVERLNAEKRAQSDADG